MKFLQIWWFLSEIKIHLSGCSCFRWALRWSEGSLEERGRGPASAWSWLLTPRCSFWMNRPRGWTPAPPTLSYYCWKGTKKNDLCNFSNPNLKGSPIFKGMSTLGSREKCWETKWMIFHQKTHIFCTNLKIKSSLYIWMILDSCLQGGESWKNHNHVHPPATVLHLQTVWHPDSAG